MNNKTPNPVTYNTIDKYNKISNVQGDGKGKLQTYLAISMVQFLQKNLVTNPRQTSIGFDTYLEKLFSRAPLSTHTQVMFFKASHRVPLDPDLQNSE